MAPRVSTIGAGVPFLDSLAKGLLERFGGGATTLTSTTILLPTRRACLGLRDGFLRHCGGEALLLPRLIPIGDVDPDSWDIADPVDCAGLSDAEALSIPPAISGLKRQFLLTRLVQRWHGADDVRAVALARELGRLLDEIQTERVSLDGIANLVPEDYAAHWQRTVTFLEILTRHWPKVLEDLGVIDPTDRRNRLLDAVATRWRVAPPVDPIIAAGSTGSIPATADLLAVVAELPAGHVVLPGLDRDLDEPSWEAIDETHPQFGLKTLLARLGVDRRAVVDWPSSPSPPRAKLLSLSLKPAVTTAEWRYEPPPPHEAIEGLERIDCPSPQEEAGVIALKMRGTLEEADRTAALVTRDRTLARRVAAELKRWGLTVDDSAGQPLGETMVGSFLRLAAKLFGDRAAPVPLLSLLKHPLAAGGESPVEFRVRTRALERAVLRGPRPTPGLEGVAAALDDARELDGDDDLVDWFAGVCEAGRAFDQAVAAERIGIDELVRHHLRFTEWLATSDQIDGATRLWSNEAGEAAAAFFSEVIEAADVLPAIAGTAYPAMLDGLLAESVVRPRRGGHARLNIWGPLEARLQHADLMILGGLNEGSWPPDPPADPWLSRPMRAAFGLSSPERRIGLAAHDFAQGAAAAEVVLTRAEKVDGKPTVPARWLSRLEALSRGWRWDVRIGAGGAELLAWRRWLDTPRESISINPPAPCPPVDARPRRLTVTDIESWMRDPYAIYARHILKLEPLDPIDPAPGPADRGSFIHAVLEAYVRAFPDAPPEDACGRLLEIGRDLITSFCQHDEVAGFWWPGFVRIAEWFVDHERITRESMRAVYGEVTGSTRIDGPAGEFIVAARADRIEETIAGTLNVINYKTGVPPSSSEVSQGYSPQLALEAMIAEDGGFPGIPATPVGGLAYWHLSGGTPAGRIKPLGDATELVAAARTGLTELVRRFDDPTTPYHAEPRATVGMRFSDYEHLARVLEWSAAEEDV